jgi:hypothetical protein
MVTSVEHSVRRWTPYIVLQIPGNTTARTPPPLFLRIAATARPVKPKMKKLVPLNNRKICPLSIV